MFAASGYLARRGQPEGIDDLDKHDMVTARHLLGQPLVLQREGTVATVQPHSVVVGDDLAFVSAMVDAGAGYAPMPLPSVRAKVDTGQLVQLLPAWTMPPLEPTIVWPRRRFEIPRVRAFVEFVTERFRRSAPV